MKFKYYCLLSGIMVCMGFQSQAQATIITFDDLSTFLVPTGASATDPLPNLGLIPGGAGASQTLGNLTFTITPPSSELYIGTAGISGIDPNPWTTLLPGNQIAISHVENLNIDLSIQVYSFGFKFAEPINNPFDPNPRIDSTFEASLFNGGTFVDSFNFNVPNEFAAFVGVWTDSFFDRVEIRETVGGIEDEYFGQFYTGTIPVPDPATLYLLGSGLVVIVGLGNKRSSRNVKN